MNTSIREQLALLILRFGGGIFYKNMAGQRACADRGFVDTE